MSAANNKITWLMFKSSCLYLNAFAHIGIPVCVEDDDPTIKEYVINHAEKFSQSNVNEIAIMIGASLLSMDTLFNKTEGDIERHLEFINNCKILEFVDDDKLKPLDMLLPEDLVLHLYWPIAHDGGVDGHIRPAAEYF